MAATNSHTTYSEIGMVLSKTAPSASTEGQPLKGLTSICLQIAAPSGQTFTGGTMACYILDTSVGSWARLASGDFTVPFGFRFVAFDPVLVVAPRAGRILWASVSVTLSGAGTTLDSYQLGFNQKKADRYT